MPSEVVMLGGPMGRTAWLLCAVVIAACLGLLTFASSSPPPQPNVAVTR